MPIKVERFLIQACCGRKSLIFRADQPLTEEVLAKLVQVGFKPHDNLVKAGILYADNDALIISGPFGSDRLQVSCKMQDCEQNLKDFEELLLKLE